MRDFDLELARDLLDNGAVLLDVRTWPEYAELHVPGAIHVPIDELPAFIPELDALVDGRRTTPIVVYCKLGRRAARAKALLEHAGFPHVTVLGGIEVEPLAGLIARGEPLFGRPPPDLRPILYQFFRDFPFVESGGPQWNPLAWSMGLRTGAEAERLAYQALGATLPVPGLGLYQPYRQRALLDFTRGQIQSASSGGAFAPWQGFQDGAPQG
jgi:rhodanese-related sulfurtransferase